MYIYPNHNRINLAGIHNNKRTKGEYIPSIIIIIIIIIYVYRYMLIVNTKQCAYLHGTIKAESNHELVPHTTQNELE